MKKGGRKEEKEERETLSALHPSPLANIASHQPQFQYP